MKNSSEKKTSNNKRRTIFKIAEAKAMVKKVLQISRIEVNSLTDREIFAIANEDLFWLTEDVQKDIHLYLKKLKEVHVVIDEVIASSGYVKDSYHFKKRAIERYSLEEIKSKLKTAIKFAKTQSELTMNAHMAVDKKKRPFECPQTKMTVVVKTEGQYGLELVTTLYVEEKKEENWYKKKKPKSKKGKKTRAQIRAEKEQARLKEMGEG